MSKFHKQMIVLAGLCLVAGQLPAEIPVVTNVVATQQVSNKLVDITYDVFDADGDTLKVRIEISSDGGTNYSVPAFSFTGDIGDGVTTGANKLVVWDAAADWDGEYSDEMRVKVIAVDGKGLPGLEWGTEVAAGGFLMGQDGGAEGSGPSLHVNIPWSYWLSKYEITAQQYADYLNTALVAGEVTRVGTTEVQAKTNVYEGIPGNVKLINMGDTRDVRWNVNNFECVSGKSNFPVRVTWYGALAFAQHYGYDLPTEAEWEKAARGPEYDDEDEHQVYPWGDTMDPGYANYYASGDPYVGSTPVGYYDGNQTPVGPDMANGYGLYDIIGNVLEWTRSRWVATVESYDATESTTNSINSLAVQADRVIRGGSCYYSGDVWILKCYGRLSKAITRDESNGTPDLGFRVIRRAP